MPFSFPDMLDIDATTLIPHRDPMLLVKGILEVDLDKAYIKVATMCTTKDLLYDASLNGVIPTASVEIMAQAIGLHSGYSDIQHGITPAQMGKLLSVKQYRSYTKALPVNIPLEVEAQGILHSPPVGVFSCNIRMQGELLAEAEITVYREE